MPFIAGTKVQNTDTGKQGIVVEDICKSCNDNEVIVIYEGEQLGDMTDTSLLENLGQEHARADLRKCGFGQGDKCCIFLTTPRVPIYNPTDCQCERFGPLRNEIIKNLEGKTSKRWPTEPYPRCQIFK